MPAEVANAIEKNKKLLAEEAEAGKEEGGEEEGKEYHIAGYVAPVDRFTTCEILRHRGGSVVNSGSKDLWQAVLWVTGYYIWKKRNDQVFKNKGDSAVRVFHEIQLRSFEWISRRSKNRNFSWEKWIEIPHRCGEIMGVDQ
uniref:Reverse transcriptase domain, reverse transcriptase zinc-binding domain protein n=1 Tax=Tanacetum cinerariifolium TaxID=118510 RepID=A0A6L2JJP3_TANCI|nr:reverse transcriptase domain, reverse transcriptase zinc-binding domain protein [Tanacetum cinerariifolium]